MSVATEVLESYLDELSDRDPAGWFQQRIYHAERTVIARALDRVRYAENAVAKGIERNLTLVADEQYSKPLDKPD